MYHPVDPDKVFRLLGPRRQIHVTHHPPVLPHSQMVAAAVDEHLREVVELGNELLRFTGEKKKAEFRFRSFIRGRSFFRRLIARRCLRVRDATLEDRVVKKQQRRREGKKKCSASR